MTKYAFLFWYKETDLARTEYIWIIATSPKQARYIFQKKGFHLGVYDYCRQAEDHCFLKSIQSDSIGTIYGSDGFRKLRTRECECKCL